MKKKHFNIDPKHIIIISCIWIISWIIILNVFDVIDSLSAFFAEPFGGLTSGRDKALIVSKIPIIIGCFTLAYGIELTTKDKWSKGIITVLLGIIFAIISIPVTAYLTLLIN